jgi:hypothetical protein
MSAYHQIGNHSESMILEKELSKFAGAILSPVNYAPDKTIEQCARFRKEKVQFDIVFDPQLYVPESRKGQLPAWGYFPKDFATADQSSISWWKSMVENLVAHTAPFQPDAICSPAYNPRMFDDAYYDHVVQVANHLYDILKGIRPRPMLTAIVGLDDVGRNSRHLSIATILSRFSGKHIYLVFADSHPPRLERTDSQGLEGAMRLIRLLVRSGMEVTIGFTSSELLLWKYAGAQHAATGKFFNLRRFTPGRWEDDDQGGGSQIWYWFEPALLAFLREADLGRYRREGFLIDGSHSENPVSQSMLVKLASPAQERMKADSWRQFLHWFAYAEEKLNQDPQQCGQMLATAAESWKKISDAKLPFEEVKNNGEWIRIWTIAANEITRRAD